MAEIRIRNTNERISADQDVRNFLEGQEVVYEHWDTNKLPTHLQENFVLSDATPNLDELLKKFEAVHTHTEDEIRAITAGKGIFIIKGAGDVGYFDVELTAGDVISVPENKAHFFTLMDNRAIVAVRLFIETNGWIAEPYEDPAFINA